MNSRFAQAGTRPTVEPRPKGPMLGDHEVESRAMVPPIMIRSEKRLSPDAMHHISAALRSYAQNTDPGRALFLDPSLEAAQLIDGEWRTIFPPTFTADELENQHDLVLRAACRLAELHLSDEDAELAYRLVTEFGIKGEEVDAYRESQEAQSGQVSEGRSPAEAPRG